MQLCQAPASSLHSNVAAVVVGVEAEARRGGRRRCRSGPELDRGVGRDRVDGPGAGGRAGVDVAGGVGRADRKVCAPCGEPGERARRGAGLRRRPRRACTRSVEPASLEEKAKVADVDAGRARWARSRSWCRARPCRPSRCAWPRVGVGVAGARRWRGPEGVVALGEAGERARRGAGLPGAGVELALERRAGLRGEAEARGRGRVGPLGPESIAVSGAALSSGEQLVVPESVKVSSGLGQELPLVAAGVERELEDAEGPGVLHLRVGQRRVQRVVLRAALADHELAHAALVVQLPVGRLGREALVGVVVAAVDELGAVLVEQLPERGRLRERAVGGPGAPARVVPVGAHAASGVGGEVLLEPLVLLGARAAAADQLAVAVQHDEVPAAEVVAVPALAALPGRGRRSRRSSRRRRPCRTRGRPPPAWCATCGGPRAGRSSPGTRRARRGSAPCRRRCRSRRAWCRGGARWPRRRWPSTRRCRRGRAAPGRPAPRGARAPSASRAR